MLITKSSCTDAREDCVMQNKFFLADALAIDHDRKVVTCNDGVSKDNFEVKYDKLAIATGSQGSTFGIPGKVPQQTSPHTQYAGSKLIMDPAFRIWG